MSHAQLDRLEGDVRDARRRMKSDLEVLRAPETFSNFKQEVLSEARQSRDDMAVTETVQRWSADMRAAASQATTSAQSLVANGSQSLQHIVMDKQERDKVLLGAAAAALTAALGLAFLRHA